MVQYPSSAILSCWKGNNVGRDNHPRVRQQRKIHRKKSIRESYDRILIVCEGSKTEPQYFEEIRQFYRLNTANIRVLHSEYGTTPQQIVDFARDKCLETKQWEKVYCVFDRDDHHNFDNALKSAEANDKKFKNELKKPIRFFAIKSIPCFELWFLLHFDCHTRETHRSELRQLLRQDSRLPNYEKGQCGNFELTRCLLETAYLNATRLKEEQQRHGRENPFTNVDMLVKELTNLRAY